jgi:hypothetical protein
VIDLADEIGWHVPHRDPDAMRAWFTAGAATKDLLEPARPWFRTRGVT